MGLQLSDEQIKDVYNKTEGWIAAMQLTALSASSKNDALQAQLPAAKLLEDDRHFSHYVISEILEHQPEQLSNFMLESSCLLRLNNELCDAIRDTDNSQELIEQLIAKKSLCYSHSTSKIPGFDIMKCSARRYYPALRARLPSVCWNSSTRRLRG